MLGGPSRGRSDGQANPRHTAAVDEQRRQRMCTGKKRFKDEAAAQQALHTMNPWGTDDAVPAQLRTYRCEYCGRWHFTSQPPR